MDKENVSSHEQPQKNIADDLYNQSLEIINDAIKETNLGGFMPVSLAIPQRFDSDGSNKRTASGKTDFFSVAKDLFTQQEQLFAEQQMHQQNEMESDASAQETPKNELPGNPTQLTMTNSSQQDEVDVHVEANEGDRGVIQVPDDESLAAINELLNSG